MFVILLSSCFFLHLNCSSYTFYRAMHFSANCKARSCDRMSSVRPPVTLVDCDHIGWNSSKVISRLVSLGCSLSADLNIRGLLQGKHPEILAQSDPPPVDLSVGDIRSQIADEWLRIAQRSQWEPIGNHHRSFEWCHRWSPTTSPSTKKGFPCALRYENDTIRYDRRD